MESNLDLYYSLSPTDRHIPDLKDLLERKAHCRGVSALIMEVGFQACIIQ